MTTFVYASVVLLSIVVLTTLAVTSSSYSNRKDLITKIDNNLTECLGRGEC